MAKGLAVLILQKMRNKKHGIMEDENEMPEMEESEEKEEIEETRGLSLDSEEAKSVLEENFDEGSTATFYVSGTVISKGKDGSAEVEVTKVSKSPEQEDKTEPSMEKDKPVRISPAPLPS